MDNEEARALGRAHANELRQLSYEELRQRFLNDPETHEVVGPSGVTYQVETFAFWDDRNREELRVRINIDDGGWRSFMPLGEDFIVAPDGSFVGE